MLFRGWKDTLDEAYRTLDGKYRLFLEEDNGYIPHRENYLNAFKTLPKGHVKYILFGQDPYPREESASGYAFIDANVKSIFSNRGLSKEVNRATSLRNFIKMVLLARGDLCANDLSQEAIATIDKRELVDSIDALRVNFEKQGVLLLNTALVFTDKKSSTKHAKAWQPFMKSLLASLEAQQPKLILFGAYAKALERHLSLEKFETIALEHPYNHTFVTNPDALSLFGPMKLLDK